MKLSRKFVKHENNNLRNRIIVVLLSVFVAVIAFVLYIFSIFDFNLVTKHVLIKNPYLMLALLVVMLIIFFMLIILFAQRYIFDPIYKMTRAAENIRAGNLNYPITYVGDDEIGAFCNEFDKMRVRLRDTIAEQHEIEKRRKRLIASITHDLRTPLTSIKGYVEAIQDGIVKDEAMYTLYLDTIIDKTDQLNRLIDDLSIYTKQELGEFTLNRERLHSAKLLDNYFSHKLDEFERSPIRLELNRPFIATYIEVDPYRFTQILDNLIGNAKKYARTKIAVSTYVTDYHLRIEIADDGEGIPADMIEHIFDPFFMVNRVKDQKEKGGSGLGLAIVKQLVEGHGGQISVKSKVGEGTQFTIDIPMNQ
jgi:signal transduction histidine kinase